jgi:predicted RNase H-like HicB family nuclease
MPEPYADQYQVVVKVHLDGNAWGAVVGKNPIEGVAGFGYTVNEAMVDVTKQMEFYHRNWEEFAEPPY